VDVKAGQIWKEVDPRITRFLRIVQVGEETVIAQTVDADGDQARGSRRESQIAKRRSNGKRGDYVLIKEAS
jgi:hypothetical protein